VSPIALRFAAFFLAAALVAADLSTKRAVFSAIDDMGSGSRDASIVVVPGFLTLRQVLNPGGVWGIGKDHGGILVAYRGVAILALLALLARAAATQPRLLTGLSLVLAGAAGNLWDSARLGHVRDFLYFHVGNAYFPAFNVADVCICVGAAFLVAHITCERR
jgi:signal peptidase II